MGKTELVTRDYTIHLSKRLHKTSNKRKAPKAVKEIKAFASKVMGTNDVRIGADLNKAIWSGGVKNVATRIRVRIARKRNDDEEADEQLYSLCNHVIVSDFKGLETENVV